MKQRPSGHRPLLPTPEGSTMGRRMGEKGACWGSELLDQSPSKGLLARPVVGGVSSPQRGNRGAAGMAGARGPLGPSWTPSQKVRVPPALSGLGFGHRAPGICGREVDESTPARGCTSIGHLSMVLAATGRNRHSRCRPRCQDRLWRKQLHVSRPSVGKAEGRRGAT